MRVIYDLAAARAPFDRPCDHVAMAFVLFGLTGGLACGKSSVATRWRSRGLPIVDADELAREVLEQPDGAAGEIAVAFGADVVGADGRLDRQTLAARAFADPALRGRLEAITHPRIAEACRARAEQLARQGHPLACYEAALLVESARADAFRPLVVVTAPPGEQLARAAGRGMPPDEASARIRAQAPTEQKAALADWVIANDGSLQALRVRADQVLDAICVSVGVDPGRYPAPAS
jgi:dephospho-CoA kinase